MVSLFVSRQTDSGDAAGGGPTTAAPAEKVGVTRETVADLEAEKIEPRSDLIEHVAVALGRRLRDFAEE